ncbi:EXPERA domain-containing protein [Thermogemmatispora sp.]|uniref:EXPERA domain-containing protein n=1 Tax=Thermogemmatispora sp. TaxID=1968838 RepID=UPI0035E458A2
MTTLEPVPLSQRRLDWILIAFFAINLLFVTYLIDIEQIIIPDPWHFSYPLWPPRPMIDLIHWWGQHFDPLLMARPVFFKVTIWLDDLLYGPFYLVAIYAYVKGREWIRLPSIIYAVAMIEGVVMILSEEAFGLYRSPQLALVVAANASWIIFPLLILLRMGLSEHPFSRPAALARPAMAGEGARG